MEGRPGRKSNHWTDW